MSGNPVPRFDRDCGVRIPLSPVLVLVEKVYLTIIDALYAPADDGTTIVTEDIVPKNKFIDILRTGYIPKEVYPYLKYLVPSQSEDYWRNLDIQASADASLFPGAKVVEEAFYALIDALLRRPEDGIPQGVFTKEEFRLMVQTGIMPKKMLAIITKITPNISYDFWDSLMSNFDKAMYMAKKIEDKNRPAEPEAPPLPQVFSPANFTRK